MVGHDASGNPILKDIGTYLRDNIKKRITVRLRHPPPPAVLSVNASASTDSA